MGRPIRLCSTIYRAFNRVTATIFGGSLAIGIHYLADTSDQTADPVIRGAFVFLIALVASFARLIPTVKRQYDYGMMTFILTFSLVSISGYCVDQLVVLAHGRCFNIALGSSICVNVCMLVNPIWAGANLHILCVKNMEKLAASLDGCVTGYFAQCGKLNSKEAGNQGLEGYKCVLTSKPSKDSMAMPVFTFANQAGLDMLEMTLIAMQDITLEKIFDDQGRKTLYTEFSNIMQQGFACLQGGICVSSMGRPDSYERAVVWKVSNDEEEATAFASCSSTGPLFRHTS